MLPGYPSLTDKGFKPTSCFHPNLNEILSPAFMNRRKQFMLMEIQGTDESVRFDISLKRTTVDLQIALTLEIQSAGTSSDICTMFSSGRMGS